MIKSGKYTKVEWDLLKGSWDLGGAQIVSCCRALRMHIRVSTYTTRMKNISLWMLFTASLFSVKGGMVGCAVGDLGSN